MFPFPFSFLAPTASGLSDIDNLYSMEFDGVDDYFDAGTGLGDSLGTYTGDLTLSFWFNADTLTEHRGVFYMGSFSSAQGQFQVNMFSGEMLFRNASNRIKFSFSNNSMSAGTWYHIVFVYKAGDIANSKAYVDGAEATMETPSGTFPNSLPLTGLKTIIGGYFSTTYLFKGKLDEIALFDYALDSGQIEEIYNATSTGKTADLSSMATPPVAWYRMGD